MDTHKDYKISRIRDNGVEKIYWVKFYTGKYETQEKKDVLTGKTLEVNIYQRSDCVGEKEFRFLNNVTEEAVKKEIINYLDDQFSGKLQTVNE